MVFVFYLALVGVLCSLAYYVAAALCALRFAREASRPAPPIPNPPPTVVLLKPLHGAGAHLCDNLKTFLALDYPNVKLVAGVDSESDPAVPIVRKLEQEHVKVPVILSVGQDPSATNRKVGKLLKMVEFARDGELLVLSDADVSVEPDHLRRVVNELISDERVGVVTCLYRARSAPNLASRLDALFVNTDFVPMALLSHAFEAMGHAFGATVAMKRAVVEVLDNFAVLKNMLADDFLIGKLGVEHGYEVRLSSSLVTVWSEQSCFRDFWRHQLRWARTYRTVRPLSVATIIIHGPFWALTLMATDAFSSLSLALASALVAVRIVFAALITVKVLRLELKFLDLLLTLVKDLVMTAVWAVSLLGNEVFWGGKKFRLSSAGELEELKA